MPVTKQQERLQWRICPYCGNNKTATQEDINVYGEEHVYSHSMIYCVTPNCQGVRRSYDNPNTIKPVELTKIDFKHGHYYYGKCRNARIAIYNAETDKFVYMRNKFDRIFPEEIGHAAHDNGFDLFEPYGEYLNPPFEIPLIDPRS